MSSSNLTEDIRAFQDGASENETRKRGISFKGSLSFHVAELPLSDIVNSAQH